MQKSVSVKVVGAVLASLAATVVISTPSALAAAKAGGACKKSEVGKTTTAGSANLECKATGKAGKWVRVTAPATTAAPVTTAAPAPATTPPATAAPTAAAPVVSAENGKGVTDSTIKIGFLDASFRDPDGFTPTSTGNTTALVGAIVDYVNANGGIGGRKVTPVIKQFNLSLSNVDQAAALCASFGDDEKVFALSSQSVIVATASKECFAKKKVVYLEGGGSFPFDTKTIERMAPYAYQTNLPAIDRIGPSYAKMLLDEKFFGADPKGTKIGILSMGDDAYKAGVEALKAELKKSGVEAVDTVFFDTTSQDTVSRDSAAASARFAAKGITHVVSLVSAGNVMQFLWSSEDNKYFPRMSFTSTDNIRIVQNGPSFGIRAVSKASFENAIAIGFNPVTDTEDIQNSWPTTGSESKCLDIWKAKKLVAGLGARYTSRYALSYCDNLFFLKTVGDKIKGGLNADNFAAQVEKLGAKGFDPAVGWLTKFGPGRYDGGDGYRVLKYNPGCSRPINGCFEYASAVKPFL